MRQKRADTRVSGVLPARTGGRSAAGVRPAVLLLALLTLCLLTRPVRAAGAVEMGDFSVTSDNAAGITFQNDYADPRLTITQPGSYTVAMKTGVTGTTGRILISASTGTVNLTLAGVNIDRSSTTNGYPAFYITGSCTTNLILAEGSTNTIKSGPNFAGLQNETHTLVIGGTGTLSASGLNGGAGIGGGIRKAGSNITITGGTINAAGGEYAAGIGGGDEGIASNITITGGTVNAAGGNIGAGIGCGHNCTGVSCSNITITGGTVNAVGSSGAGIGTVYNQGACSVSGITISGGKVTANGGTLCAGIGADVYGNASNITITGGIVTATGSTAYQTNIFAIQGLTVSPLKYTRISAVTGGSADSAAQVSGSPFYSVSTVTTGTYFHSESIWNCVLTASASNGTVSYRVASSVQVTGGGYLIIARYGVDGQLKDAQGVQMALAAGTVSGSVSFSAAEGDVYRAFLTEKGTSIPICPAALAAAE